MLGSAVVRENAGISDRRLCLPEYLPAKKMKKGDAVETQASRRRWPGHARYCYAVEQAQAIVALESSTFGATEATS
jgi:hypothetical protein